MATYCIGDVHGCFDELKQLLQLIHFDNDHDHLWFVGDLVNRGPKSLEVLRLIRQIPNTVVVLGNHDLHLLNFYYTAITNGHKDHLLSLYNKMATFETGPMESILTASDGEKLVEWLRMRPLVHYSQEYKCVLAHAGIYPGWDLIQALSYAKEAETLLHDDLSYINFLKHMYGNKPSCWHDDLEGWDRIRFIVNAFTRMRFCDSKGNLEFSYTNNIDTTPADYQPWFEIPWRKTKELKIIFGHWATLEGVTNNANALALDTGCAWGKSLTALRVDDGARFSCPKI